MLLPVDQTKKGYRLVVLLETQKNHWRSLVLERSDQNTPTTAVISLAAPGNYKEAEGSKKIVTKTEGIFSEDMGRGVMIYYWNVERFRSIVTSD